MKQNDWQAPTHQLGWMGVVFFAATSLQVLIMLLVNVYNMYKFDHWQRIQIGQRFVIYLIACGLLVLNFGPVTYVTAAFSVEYSNPDLLSLTRVTTLPDEIHAEGNSGTYGDHEFEVKFPQSNRELITSSQQIDSETATTVNSTYDGNRTYTFTHSFGSWTFSTRENCSVHTQDYRCRIVTFLPNDNAINTNSTGKTIESELKYELEEGGEVVSGQTLTITIYGTPTLSVNLSSNSDSRINIDGNTATIIPDNNTFQSPHLEGTISPLVNSNFQLELIAKETVGVLSPVVGSEGTVSTETINGQNVSVKSFGTNFTYGKWLVASDLVSSDSTSVKSGDHKIWFEINNDNLRNLADGSTVTYTFDAKIKTSDGMIVTSVPDQTFTVIISRDYPITIDVSNTTLKFPENHTGDLSLDLSFSTKLNIDTSFNVTTANGTAIAGTDFNAINNVKYDARNVSSYSIPFSLIDDSNIESNEEFTIRISNLVGLKFADGMSFKDFTITIVDDESTTLNITNTDLSVDEDDGNFAVEFSLSDISEVEVTVAFSLTSGTATIGTDVTNIESPNNTATIPIGQTTGTFLIPIIADSNREGPESFSLTVSAIGATVATGDTSKTITIIDGETPKIEIDHDTGAINEDAGDVFVWFRVRGIITEPFSFDVSVSSDTAIGSSDFVTQQTMLSFNSNLNRAPILVSIINDNLVENDETFMITLTNLSSPNAQFPNGGTQYSEIFTIMDDDSRILSVTNDTLSVSENVTGGEFVLNVQLSKANNSLPVTFYFSVVGDSATEVSDYTVPTNKRVTMEAGSTEGSFSIPIINDNRHEGNEKFKIRLSFLNGATFKEGEPTLEVIVTIVDDEKPAVILPTTELTPTEDDSNIEISVTLAGPSNRSFTVSYVTADVTATMGEDYTYKQGVLSFTPGTTEKSITIPILEDSNHEGEETFEVQFTISIGSAIFVGGATTATKSIVILDDESPTLSIANTEFYVSEDVGSSGYRLEFVLSGPVRSDTVTFNFAVNGGTAVKGADYNVLNQPVWISTGRTLKRVPISIIDDTMIEGNKTIRFTLTNLNGAVFEGGVDSITRTITIVDDERTTLSFSNPTYRVDEDVSAGKIDVDIMLTPVSPYDVTFMVSTQNGTAIKGQDYTELESQPVTIAGGNATGTISIPILNDSETEGEQSFTLKIESVVGATLAENMDSIEQIITIVDDEASTIFLDNILSAENVIEGYGNYSMNLSTPTALDSSVTISFSTMALTATSGTDFTAPANQTITIMNGMEDVSLSGFTIPNNATSDGDKTFKITLAISSGNAVFLGGVTQKDITMTIVDDESFLLSTRTSAQSFQEDVGEVIVYYSLSRAISSAVTFDVALTDGASSAGEIIYYTEKGTDYEDLNISMVTIPPGQTSGSISISILDDSETERIEGFTLELTNLMNAVFPPCNNCSLRTKEIYFYIEENDFATISFEETEYSVSEEENGTELEIDLILSDLVTPNSKYSIEFTDGTARNGVDFSFDPSLSNRQVIDFGDTRRTIPITILYNPSYTGNKTFEVSLIRPEKLSFPDDAETVNGALKYTRSITIIDQQAPAIEITNTSFNVAENVSGGNFVVNYVIENPATRQVSFEYNLIDDTAIKSSDYTEEANRTEIIRVGESSGSISIPIIDDDLNEGNETFTLVLSNLVGGGSFVGGSISLSQTITILDNELPTLSITNTEFNVMENVASGKLVLEVMLSGSTEDGDSQTERRVIFAYTLIDGSATKGIDYTEIDATERVVTFEEGETTKTFEIPILDDTTQPIAEGSETFDIRMTISTGAVFDGGGNMDTQTITIHDNELPTLSFENTEISAVENNEDAEIDVTVKLSIASHQNVIFEYDLTDDSATMGVDYLEKGTREVTISAGSTSGTFSIPIADDLVNEGNETFTLSLSRPNGAEFARGASSISKTITIVDNELPTLNFTNDNFKVNENVGSAGFPLNLELSGATGQAVTFEYALADVTAEKGIDYTEAAESARMISIPIGSTTNTITIPIAEDTFNEGDETFTFTLSNLSGAVFSNGNTTLSTSITIVDDENANTFNFNNHFGSF